MSKPDSWYSIGNHTMEDLLSGVNLRPNYSVINLSLFDDCRTPIKIA